MHTADASDTIDINGGAEPIHHLVIGARTLKATWRERKVPNLERPWLIGLKLTVVEGL